MPNLRLKVKDGLSEKATVFAMKSLWWIEQFFKDENPSIHHNVLFDSRGTRGSQEKKSYILSESALMKKKIDLQVGLKEIYKQRKTINDKMKEDSEKLRLLNSEVQKVREAESFITMKHERLLRLEQLKKIKNAQEKNDVLRQTLSKKRDEHFIKQTEYKMKIEVLEQDLDLYRQLGEMKHQYEELQTKKEQLEIKEKDEKRAKDAQKELEETYERTQSDVRKIKRLKDQYEEEIERIKRDLNMTNKQIERQEEEIKESDFERTGVIQQLNELKQIIPDIYQKVQTANQPTNLSLRQLKQLRENSEIGFNSARNETGIDPEAPKNYEIVQKEYERREDEFKRTSLLLEQNKERAEEIESKLEMTVSMNVRKIQQRFQTYMGYFQFEGDISWEKVGDKRGRVIFKLFIKARKEGHRGAMEDVSTKARGGKVGKGVSGGEESLSSLLFALALLQNLDTSPGFIILDEFDSALDEQRKVKVFELYANELQRKLIILSPKSHEKAYNDKFSKAFIVKHDPTVPISSVTGIIKI